MVTRSPVFRPLPEGRMIGFERRMPILVPTQHVGVLPETFRIPFLAEPVDDVGIAQIGLTNELCGRIVVFLLPPMNCDLGLAGFDDLLFLTNFRHENYPFSLGSILCIDRKNCRVCHGLPGGIGWLTAKNSTAVEGRMSLLGLYSAKNRTRRPLLSTAGWPGCYVRTRASG